MDYLDDIHKKIIEDLDKKDVLTERLFGSNGTFILTSELRKSNSFSTSLQFKIFKPSNPLMITGVVIIIIAWLFIFYSIATFDNLNQGALGIVMLSMFLVTVGLLWQLFYDPTLNYMLRIDQFGLGTDDQFFTWSQIHETSILEIPLGKGHAEYLIIILSNGDYWNFDLSNFRGFFGVKKTLSSYIEHYKSAYA